MGATLGISSLAGCGGAGTQPQETTVSGETAKEQPQQEASGETDEVPADREVTIWCWDTGDTRKQMHDEFTKATGIKVNLVAVESKDMTQKLQTTLASGGELPDIAWLEATFRGKLLSLDIWEDITADP